MVIWLLTSQLRSPPNSANMLLNYSSSRCITNIRIKFKVNHARISTLRSWRIRRVLHSSASKSTDKRLRFSNSRRSSLRIIRGVAPICKANRPHRRNQRVKWRRELTANAEIDSSKVHHKKTFSKRGNNYARLVFYISQYIGNQLFRQHHGVLLVLVLLMMF